MVFWQNLCNYLKILYIASTKTKILSLRRTLLILFIVLFSTIFAQGQIRTAEVPTPIVRYYPNPATTSVTFDFQKDFDNGFSIQLYNFIGKKVYELKNMPQRTNVNLTDFNRGVYIYQLRDRTGRIMESGRFQVSR